MLWTPLLSPGLRKTAAPATQVDQTPREWYLKALQDGECGCIDAAESVIECNHRCALRQRQSAAQAVDDLSQGEHVVLESEKLDLFLKARELDLAPVEHRQGLRHH